MKENRREFLKKSGNLLKGGLLLYTAELLIPRAVCTDTGIRYDWEKHLYGFVVDTYKCIGCGRCVRACKEENNVPDGFYRTWVERYIITEHEEVLVDSPRGGLDGFNERNLKDKTAIYHFDEQCIPYAIVLERVLGHSIDNLTVKYLSVYIDIEKPQVQPYEVKKLLVCVS